MKPLPNCHDCGAAPGETHRPGCDTEVCSHCGGQTLVCGGCPDSEGNMRHDAAFARWTGIWPGYAEARELGLFAKFSRETGWVTTDANDPEARPSLNAFYEQGYHEIFLIKPTKENGRLI